MYQASEKFAFFSASALAEHIKAHMTSKQVFALIVIEFELTK